MSSLCFPILSSEQIEKSDDGGIGEGRYIVFVTDKCYGWGCNLMGEPARPGPPRQTDSVARHTPHPDQQSQELVQIYQTDKPLIFPRDGESKGEERDQELQ